MTTSEFSNQFDLLYNNITSNQAPGLDEYEKSVFLTKAQDEILKAYFNPKGNKYQEGFDGSEKRLIDFSMLMRTAYVSVASSATAYHNVSNSGFFMMPTRILMYINETLVVNRNNTTVKLTVVPINYTTFTRLMSKPFKRPLKNQAWRLLISGNSTGYTYCDYRGLAIYLNAVYESGSNLTETLNLINLKTLSVIEPTGSSYTDLEFLKVNDKYLHLDTATNKFVLIDAYSPTTLDISTYAFDINNYISTPVASTSNIAELIPGNGDTIQSNGYIVRYVARPKPIVLADFTNEGVTIDGENTAMTSELDPILHEEILQRAVELAKAAYSGSLQDTISVGNASATNLGIITGGKSNN